RRRGRTGCSRRSTAAAAGASCWAPAILPAAGARRRDAAGLVEVFDRAVPPPREAAGQLRQVPRVDHRAGGDGGVELVQVPPADLVDDLLLEGGPAAQVELGHLHPGEEELLVLAAGHVGEVEDRAAGEHRALEVVRGEAQPGLLAQ